MVNRQIRGRPLIHIPEEQLVLLMSFNFSPGRIADMVQCSAKTVRRRIVEFGLEEMRQYSTLSDSQLDEITAEFVHNYPNSGQISYDGFFKGKRSAYSAQPYTQQSSKG